jgi:SAM-dependent methyltransferase
LSASGCAAPSETLLEPDLKAGSRLRLPLIDDRIAFLEDLVARHQRIAHLGCTDWPYTEHRLARGDLLHQRLLRFGEVTGIDVDREGVERLVELMPGASFLCLDIADGVPAAHRGAYDLVLVAETLEHVPDPVAFLRGCGQLLSDGGTICVTVPNACSPKIGIRTLFGRERVHPDHFVYYSPRTLERTLRAAGLQTDSMASYFAVPSALGRVLDVGLRAAHRLSGGPVGEGLIALAHASGDAPPG